MARRNSPDVASATKKEGFCGRDLLFFNLLPVKNDVSHTENKLDGVT